MANEFTYLLGAGASVNKIPVVENFGKEIGRFAERIVDELLLPDEKFTDPNNRSIRLSQKAVQETLINNLAELSKEVQDHASVDTYAKVLYLSGEKDMFNDVKALIDAFLTAHQYLVGVDKRYDLFLATILHGGMTSEVALPRNINILSWNYDFQIELSASRFFGFRHLESAHLNLNIIPSNSSNISIDEFNMVKLNGTASGYSMSGGEFQRSPIGLEGFGSNMTEEMKMRLMEHVTANYFWFTSGSGHATPSILYAWENDKITEQIRKQALKVCERTTHLIIIGYSFPTFNRDIDRRLLGNMKNLKSVYIQCPEDDIAGVESRFRALLGKPPNTLHDIELKSDTREFFIPYEYN